MIRVDAPAKINLGLRILGRRADGFHELQTIFQAVGLRDTLTFEPRRGADFELDVLGADLGRIEDNLVLRAAHLFRERTGSRLGGRFRLKKRIPAGAGLGGGSSDAGAALRLLDHAADVALGESGRCELGAELGADVAFFSGESATAVGEGRGERLTALPALPQRTIVLGWDPEVHVATGPAYGALASARASEEAETPEALFDSAPDALDWPTAESLLVNDFEAVVGAAHSGVASLLQVLGELEDFSTLLSGSGGAVFTLPARGLSGEQIRRRLEAVRARLPAVRLESVDTLERLPAIEG